MEPPAARAFLDRMNDGVTAIVYRDETRIGAFGEPHLVVVVAFTASVPLGSAKSRAVLESFAAARARVVEAAGRATSAFDLSMEDDEGEET